MVFDSYGNCSSSFTLFLFGSLLACVLDEIDSNFGYSRSMALASTFAGVELN